MNNARRILQNTACGLLAFVSLATTTAAFAQSEPDASAPVAAPGNNPAAIETSESVEVPQAVKDERIQTRLQNILTATDWFTDPKAEVKNGVVFLAGNADSVKSREWAGDLAGKTEGVVAVVNEIEVNQPLQFGRSFSVVVTSLRQLWQDLLNRLPLLAGGVLVLLLTWVVSRAGRMIVGRAARRSRFRTSLQDLLLQLTTVVVWLAGILVAAVIIFPGMTPAKILTVLGLSSVALGFAFKDIFENFFAGVLILWRFPFDKGDYIVCGDVAGKVEEITIRMTMIRQVDGQLVIVPNAMLFKNAVDVLTNEPTRRVTIICGVAYDEDVDQSRDVIRKAVEGCESVSGDHPLQVFAQEFASSSINFEVTWWTGSTPVEVRESRDEVVAAVKRALDDAGIEIPFPYRTLTFKEPLRTLGSSTDSSGQNGEQAESVSANGR